MKPRILKWRIGWHKTEIGDHIAETALGEYSCRQMRSGRWSLWLRERCLGDKAGGVREEFELDEVKRQAQAHFNDAARKMVTTLMEPSDASSG